MKEPFSVPDIPMLAASHVLAALASVLLKGGPVSLSLEECLTPDDPTVAVEVEYEPSGRMTLSARAKSVKVVELDDCTADYVELRRHGRVVSRTAVVPRDDEAPGHPRFRCISPSA